MKWILASLILAVLTSIATATLTPDSPIQNLTTAANPDTRCASQRNPNGTGQCSACVALQDTNRRNICAFDRNTLDCVARPSGALPVNLVGNENAVQCTTLQQIAIETPRFTANELQRARTEWGRMQNHVFNGEANDPTSGRHLFTTWRQRNSGPGRCDDATNLCAFNNNAKTVWNDCPARYTRQDVQDICTASILFNIRHNRMANSRNSVVRSRFGRTMCIEHLVTAANTPSCFPIGIGFTNAPVDSSRACTPGQQSTTGPTRPIAMAQGC
ncbi:unnamed protein product [Somion occarium]|uniref:Uncharacterized protein n=1 Tax=Somion occarium TaxID=3059160 RepID=A0ABP1E434_9APHY